MQTRNSNQKDAKRVGVWLSIVLGLLIVGALIVNIVWYQQPPANAEDRPAAAQPAPAPEKPPGS